jgi:outer membrane protein assembly factor BamB
MRFRGPNGSGISTARNLPADFGPNTNVAWSVEVPAGVSSPIVAAGRVFLTGFEGDHGLTVCLALEDGQRLWQRAVESVRADETHFAI